MAEATGMASRAVQVTQNDEHSLELDIDALHNILYRSEIVDNPVVVIGIAGSLRTGKSFLMCFIMRYLREKGWKNPQWIGGDDKVADEVNFKGGRKADTKGIIIWDGIFKVENDIGEEISVLLVDTQGLFDSKMSKENNTKLFTLTVLMCSSLMLNVKSKIDERELESLQFFVEYARTYGQEEKAPFMDLIFLIRDWPNGDEIAYGSRGGEKYLDEVLSPKSNPQLNEVRSHLKSSFQMLGCFLMPHPGLEVERVDFTGRNADIEQKFLTHVAELAENILSPEVIHKKFLDGKAHTGRSLFTLLSECNEIFQSGTLPSVETMAQAMATARNKVAREESFKIYEESMEKALEAIDRNDIDAEKLKEIHEDFQRKAADHFRVSTKFGQEKERARFREHFVQECQDKLETFSQWTYAEKKKARNLSLEIVHELRSRYKGRMEEEIDGKAQEKPKLQKMHDVHREESLKAYQTEAGSQAAFVKEHMQILEVDLLLLFKKLQTVNDERERLEVLGHQEDCVGEYEGYLLVHSLSQQYRDEFEKYGPVYIKREDMEKQIQELHESYLKLFEDNWNISWPPIDNYRAKFIATLVDECKDALEMNERNKKQFKDRLEEHHSGMKVEYMTIMEKVTKEAYVEPPKLEEMHEKTQKKLMDDLRLAIASFSEEIQQECMAKAIEAFNGLYMKIKKSNESNKTDRKHMDPKTIFLIFSKAIECAKALEPFITKMMACIGPAKSAYAAIKPMVASLNIVPAVAVVAGVVGLAVVVYCVYRQYEMKNECKSQ